MKLISLLLILCCLHIGQHLQFYVNVTNPFDHPISDIRLDFTVVSHSHTWHRSVVIRDVIPPHTMKRVLVITDIPIVDYGPYVIYLNGPMGDRVIVEWVNSVGDKTCIHVCSVDVIGKNYKKHYDTVPSIITKGKYLIVYVVTQTAKNGKCGYDFRECYVVGQLDNQRVEALSPGWMVAELKFKIPTFDGKPHKLTIWVMDDPKARVSYTIYFGEPTKGAIKIEKVTGYAVGTMAVFTVAMVLLRRFGRMS